MLHHVWVAPRDAGVHVMESWSLFFFCLRELSLSASAWMIRAMRSRSPIYDPPFASAGIKSKPSTESWAYFCSWLTSRAVKPVCVNVFICVFCWRAGKCRASDSRSLISISFFGGDSRACGWPGAAEKQSLSPSTSSFHRDLTPQNVPFPASAEIK